jgi:hypothetical protein
MFKPSRQPAVTPARAGAGLLNPTAAAAFGLSLALACAIPASAHHSARLQYDMGQVTEVEGRIVDVVWRNPHVRFTVSVPDGGGEQRWTVESIPITRLSRIGVSREMLAIGDTVKVAGFPGRLGTPEMYALNLLLPDNREVLLDTPTARWSRQTIGTGLDTTPGEVGADPSLGIFRVWSNDGTFLSTETKFLSEGGTLDYPLTAAARQAQSEWDPLAPGNPFLTCAPKGMPLIMQQPNPIEFVDNGDEITLRIEEFDTVRHIYMGSPPATAEPPSLLGHSRGEWEGRTLVVRTDGINWPYFDQWGLLQSPEVQTVERFTPDAAGSRLDYELTVTDSWLFTEPVTLSKSWRWLPGDRVLPYNCTERD